MASLGTFIVFSAFVVSAAAFAFSLVGARRNQRSLIEGGIGLLHVVTALMMVASALIVHAFVVGDYSVKYVQRYSADAQPLFYKLASYWGGLDGSLMFWVALLGAFGSVAVAINRERYRLLIPWVVATISAVEMFFLLLMVVHNNPFETYLMTTPADGAGLNPLLQNFYMAIHPPLLYLGFVGMTIPFAFGIAALASGQLDDAWLRAVRRWTMTSWLFLTVGLVLGALWAYEELGWGGYWGWDPVENAGLLPWFTATAFLHSVMVQERRGMLKVWNVSLVIVTFFLTIFGTFMTRSGVVQSVHAFGEDRQLALMFSVFMVIMLTVSFGLVAHRMPMLRARHELDSWSSKEAAFLANNWVLLFASFFVLFATMFPTLSEAVTGERLTVGPPFFNKWMTPVGLILLFLTGVGPLLAWRKSSPSSLRHQFLWPGLVGVATGAGVAAFGVPIWSAGLCFALCAFVGTTVVQEFWRGAGVRRQTTGTDRLTAMAGLFARSRRRYGGYLVHLGIVLMFLGFAGSAFERQETVPLTPGQQVEVAPYLITYEQLSVTEDAQKQMVTAHLSVEKNGRALGGMFPARWYYAGREQEPTTEVALRRGPAEDLHVVLAEFDVGQQLAALQITVNPLINWIWFGAGVLIFGTFIALLPERALSFASKQVPESAVTTSLVLALAIGGAASTRLHAQVAAPAVHVDRTDVVVIVPKTPVEKELRDHLVCMCGTCGRQRIGDCTCGVAADMRAELSRLIEQGRTYDEIIEHFVAKYGSQEVLAAPIDEGFNRLAWAFPYVLGLAGIVLVGGIAVRWSRRTDDAEQDATGVSAEAAPELESRLDDELRDLD